MKNAPAGRVFSGGSRSAAVLRRYRAPSPGRGRRKRMEDAAFRQWLTQRSWAMSVRYCKVVAVLLPPAALTTDVPLLHEHGVGGLGWLLAWQVAAELVCLALIAADRWLPALRGR